MIMYRLVCPQNEWCQLRLVADPFSRLGIVSMSSHTNAPHCTALKHYVNLSFPSPTSAICVRRLVAEATFLRVCRSWPTRPPRRESDTANDSSSVCLCVCVCFFFVCLSPFFPARGGMAGEGEKLPVLFLVWPMSRAAVVHEGEKETNHCFLLLL